MMFPVIRLAEGEVGLGHLLESDFIGERREWHVAAVEETGPGLIGVDKGAGVEGAEGRLTKRGGANGARAEAGTWDGDGQL